MMRTRGFRYGILALLAAILASMFMLLLLVWQNIEAERAERTQVRLTNEVLLALRDVGRAALHGETGQRGYIITLDRRYLEPYEMGRRQIDPTMDRLRTLIGDKATARQAELLDEIGALANAKFDEIDESIARIEQGRLLDARRGVLTDEGIEAMERLQRSIREMEAIEAEVLARASANTARAEARVLPMLAAVSVLLVFALIFGILLAGRAARAEAEAAQAAALRQAHERADLLARELNHRVKNLFAVVLAIVQMSARGKPEAKAVTDNINDRIRALLTAHEVTQGDIEHPVAPLGQLVETTIAPYRSARLTASINGPEVMIPANRVTPLGLVLHELTTNAVKYGAWSCGGSLDISWVREGNRVAFTWKELGARITGEPGRKGFGTLMMDSAARQFGGTVSRDYTADGLIVRIDLPVTD